MNIIILGPQGSGKGTQADILSEKLNTPHISTGNIFRQNITDKTDLGLKVEEYLNKGALVPDEITNELVRGRLSEKNIQNGFILDGFPRNIEQAEFLNSIIKIDLALEIWISDEESIRRIGGRRSCPNCGTVYHLEYNPPKKENICDNCGEPLEIREDDKPDAIKKRLNIYHEQTTPLLEYYEKKGVLHKINGSLSIPDVTKAIFEIIKKF